MIMVMKIMVVDLMRNSGGGDRVNLDMLVRR